MGPIRPTRGIRQGDPLSPYLFIICAERLSALIRKYEQKQWIYGIKVCRRAPVISHMLFADDSYFYCKANTEEAWRVMELLEIYGKASGQKVNRGKSSIFFSSNVIQYNRVQVSQVLQMNEADAQCKYLGLPNIIGRNKSTILGFLKEKVNSRVRSWVGKHVSRSGKETLIKSVAQTLPSYAMSVFLLPFEITRDIEKILSKFWWSSDQTNKSRITWMAWERLAKHKSAGGLGFRHFRDFNLAMLGKQGWRFIVNPDSLVSRLFKARYFVDTDFLNSLLGSNPSFVWRSIFEAKHLILDEIRWRVGNGESIKIVGQPWLTVADNPYITTVSPAIDHNYVSSLMCVDRREWDIDVIKDIFNNRDQQRILDVHLDAASHEDVMYWRLENSGVYSVKSAYKFLQVQRGHWNAEENENIWRMLWRIKAPPKAVNLVSDFRVWIQDLWTEGTAKQCAESVVLCWAIWRARNGWVWTQKPSTVNRVVAAAKQYLTQWTLAQSRSSTALLQPQYDGDGASFWVKPQPNTVKVSGDAAIFKEREEVGFGLVARDSDGMLIEAITVVHYELVSPVLAEAMAVKEALSWIDARQWSGVTLESDCLVVVQAIRSKTPMRSRFGVVVTECRDFMHRLNNIELLFVKRSANMVAHTLARESYALPGRSFNRWSVPINVLRCIEMDLSQ
ncbi:hypothetical protein AgCh_031539 [Apium graveolens]